MRNDVQRALRKARARTRRLLAVLCVLPVLACSSALRGYDIAPNGLARNDERLRRMVASGRADSALKRLDPSHGLTPTDDVLRLLYQGTVAFYAGEHRTSVASFDSAAWLADERTVLRLSREAAALLSNDRALPYEPDRTERLFNAYYAALGYVRLNDRDDAAVEARRISYILETTGEDVTEREAPLHGVLRYLSGVLYEIAGDFTDADVAYRNAAAILPSLTPPTPLTGDSGDIVLLIEDGFVAHRVQHSLTLVLASDEHERLHDHDRQIRDRAADELALRVIATAFGSANEYGVGPRTGRRDWFIPAPERPRRPRCRDRPKSAPSSATTNRTTSVAGTDADSASHASGTSVRSAVLKPDAVAGKTGQADTAGSSAAGSGAATRTESPRGRKSSECKDDEDAQTYILRMAWPAYHADRRPAMSARIVHHGLEVVPPVFASISDAVLAEYERERAVMLARTIARSAAKYALVKGAEDLAGEDNDALGRLLGTIANVSTAVLEQADTRSWNLLPGGIGIARLRLPAGVHDVRVTVGSDTVDLKAVIAAGSIGVESIRTW